MKSKTRHIVVALRMAGIAGQDKLSGIFEYLSEGLRWNLAIYRTQNEFTAETVRQEIRRGADGFVIGLTDVDDALAEIARTDIPVVIMNVDPGALADRKCGYVNVKSDSEAIGREAAQTLLAQGVYRSYGYAGYRTDADWSRERGRAFRDALQKAGFIGRMFDVSHFPDRTEDRDTLAHWLRALPKPCGILAACDDRAYEIIDVCRETGIKIPQEVGMLGVNNDPLLCENSDPRLSSIQPDFRREGYLAAQALHHAPRNRDIKVGLRQVVHRETTYPISTSGKLVQNAIVFISKNAHQPLTARMVAEKMKVSRSLLDLRFRQLQGETVREVISRMRLDAVKHRLATSRDTIEQISRDCGWENINSLKNFFRKATGQSMRDWRTDNK